MVGLKNLPFPITVIGSDLEEEKHMKIAKRVKRLGTETAFAVSGEAGQILVTLKERRDTAVDILNSMEGIHCFRPNATFYLFPNVTGAMQKKGLTNYDDFRRTVLHENGVSFCTRLHFG